VLKEVFGIDISINLEFNQVVILEIAVNEV